MPYTRFRNPILWISIPSIKFNLKVRNGRPNISIMSENQTSGTTSTTNIVISNLPLEWKEKIKIGQKVYVYFSYDYVAWSKPETSNLWFAKQIVGVPYSHIQDMETHFKITLQDTVIEDFYYKNINIDLKGKPLKEVINILQTVSPLPILTNISKEKENKIWQGGNPKTFQNAIEIIKKTFAIQHSTKSYYFGKQNIGTSQIFLYDQPSNNKYWDLTNTKKSIQEGYPQLGFTTIDGYNNLRGVNYGECHFKTLLNTKIRVGDNVLINSQGKDNNPVFLQNKPKKIKIFITSSMCSYNSNGECICEYYGQEQQK